MEKIFEKLDNNQTEDAVKLIKEQLGKRNQDFIEDFIQSLSIITEMERSVVKETMPKLLSILDMEDDVIRYSMIASLKEFVPKYKDLVFPYIKDFLKYGSPKKREGMLILLKYIAETDPESLEPYYDSIIHLLSDSKDFVRKSCIEVLQQLGKFDKEEIESKILGFLKDQAEISEDNLEENQEIVEEAQRIREQKEKKDFTTADTVLMKVADVTMTKGSKLRVDEDKLKAAANNVLKEIVEVSSLEKEDLEKRELAAMSKALEKELKDEEEEIKLKKLKLKKEQKELEQKKIEQELEKIEKEKELLKKKNELDQVKRELELKRLEQEKDDIAQQEKEMLEKRMKRLKKEIHKEDYDDINL